MSGRFDALSAGTSLIHRPRNQKIALEIYGDPTETRYERAEGFEEAKDVVHEDVQVVNLKR